jgi:hypothetical protein
MCRGLSGFPSTLSRPSLIENKSTRRPAIDTDALVHTSSQNAVGLVPSHDIARSSQCFQRVHLAIIK